MSTTTKVPERVYLFSNGTEYMIWLAGSCDRCVNASGPDEPLDEVKCELERAVFETMIADDDKCPIELARRLGYREGECHIRPCTERTDEPEPEPFVPDTTTLTLPLEEAAN